MYRSFSFANDGFDPGFFDRVRQIVLRKAGELGGIAEGPGLQFSLCLDEGIKADAYRIRKVPDGVQVSASTRLGILSGCGRVLQEGCFDDDGFEPGSFEVEFAPKREFVGVYFASHFGNYYVNAPVEEVIRYVEDLALWGTSFIRVWFDFHHYTGIDDPKAQPMLERLEQILSTGSYLGMKTGYVSLANEGYSTTPEALKAEWWEQNGYHRRPIGHYHTEICPNKPGGMDLIIRNRLELFERFRNAPPALLSLGVYDQGGCTCAKCAPWAANGYIKTLEALVPEIKKHYPDCKICFCVWYLDHFIKGEWDGVYRAFETNEFLKDNIDYISAVNMNSLPENPVYAEKLTQGIGPGGKPLLGFPEISMQGCSPWGGFGANPYPARLQKDWDKIGHLQEGMWCYSEGRFEDANKFITVGLYSGRFATAQEALRGYVRAELSSRYADEILELLNILEETLPRRRRSLAENDENAVIYELEHPERIEEAAQKARALDARLPERIRNGWRWRVIWLRAMADLELKKANYYIREGCEQYLEELDRLYYTGDDTYLCVSPITRRAIRRDYDHHQIV